MIVVGAIDMTRTIHIDEFILPESRQAAIGLMVLGTVALLIAFSPAAAFADDDRVLTSQVQLFDLVVDPGEAHNVADRHPHEVARLRAAIEPWVRDGAAPATPAPQVAPAIRRQLEELGYAE